MHRRKHRASARVCREARQATLGVIRWVSRTVGVLDCDCVLDGDYARSDGCLGSGVQQVCLDEARGPRGARANAMDVPFLRGSR